jgi:hypothetical protein
MLFKKIYALFLARRMLAILTSTENNNVRACTMVAAYVDSNREKNNCQRF